MKHTWLYLLAYPFSLFCSFALCKKRPPSFCRCFCTNVVLEMICCFGSLSPEGVVPCFTPLSRVFATPYILSSCGLRLLTDFAILARCGWVKHPEHQIFFSLFLCFSVFQIFTLLFSFINSVFLCVENKNGRRAGRPYWVDNVVECIDRDKRLDQHLTYLGSIGMLYYNGFP